MYLLMFQYQSMCPQWCPEWKWAVSHHTGHLGHSSKLPRHKSKVTTAPKLTNAQVLLLTRLSRTTPGNSPAPALKGRAILWEEAGWMPKESSLQTQCGRQHTQQCTQKKEWTSVDKSPLHTRVCFTPPSLLSLLAPGAKSEFKQNLQEAGSKQSKLLKFYKLICIWALLCLFSPEHPHCTQTSRPCLQKLSVLSGRAGELNLPSWKALMT